MKTSLKLAAGLAVLASAVFVVQTSHVISPRFRSNQPLQKKPPAPGLPNKNDENFVPEGPPNCKKMMLVMAKRMMPVLRVCSSAIKEKYPDPQEFAKRQTCPLKCFMQEVEMVSADGQFSNASINTFFEKHIPENYRGIGFKVLEPCVQEFGNGKLDANDETCVDYGKVLQCMQHKGLEHCNI